MKKEEAKTMVTAANELSGSYAEVIQSLKETAQEVRETKKLWRSGNNSMLIKLGLALIAFPDPTISDIVGSALVAVGTVQAGIRKRTLYVDDVFKVFHKTFREISDIRENV